jgi:UDP-glucose 4-epimerase
VNRRVLVTGGAGYIGSVVVEELIARGAERVVVLDDLSRGHAAAVPPEARLIVGDVADGELVRGLCAEERIDGVVHLAAWSLVGQSVTMPAEYYRANVIKGLCLLEALLGAGVRRFVFSSTAAVYGDAGDAPIEETTPVHPTNPYGETKLAIEKALAWYERAYGLRYASLRYFNAAGASEARGEHHDPETHLIPIVLQVAAGKRPHLDVYGDDYPTKDGTCVRDYIHVRDLADAHVRALTALEQRSLGAYNLGCGGGFSVLEVVEAARAVTGHPIPVKMAPRRAGDPATLVASSRRITEELGWRPARQDLRAIVADAWRWAERHPDGYPATGRSG